MKPVCAAARLTCTLGIGQSVLTIQPGLLFLGGPPKAAATIRDNLPLVNIAPFVGCASLLNPNPMNQCLPDPVGPWLAMNPSFTILGVPVLEDSSACICKLGGQIRIIDSGQDLVSDRSPQGIAND